MPTVAPGLMPLHPWIRKAHENPPPRVLQQASQPASYPEQGPGTEMKKLAESIGLNQPCFGCSSLLIRMNVLFAEGGEAAVLKERDLIIRQLRKNAESVGRLELVKAAVLAVWTGLVWKVDPVDPIPGMFDEALRRAVVQCP